MVGLSFGGRLLLAVVGLLDLVVVAGCVGLIERQRERERGRHGREEKEMSCLYYLMVVVYIILISCMLK